TMRPRRIGIAPRMARSTVLFPAPLGPTRAVGPRPTDSFTSRVKPSRATSSSSSSTDRLQDGAATENSEDPERDRHQQDAERLGGAKIGLQRSGDGERQRLRAALEVPGKHQGGAEFTQRPGPAQRRTGHHAGAAHRERNTEEAARRSCAEAPSCPEKILVQATESRRRGLNVEGGG